MPRGIYIDEIGKRFGKLVVIEKISSTRYGNSSHPRYKCVCDCGNTYIVLAQNLRRGTKSCGCDKIINESGKIYGNWHVLNEYKKDKKNKVYWLCKCSCGNSSYVQGTELRNGHSKSCGKCMPLGEASFNNLYVRMVSNAKKRKIYWNLSKQDVKNVTSQSCYYCGINPSQVSKTKNQRGEYKYNGLDRIDSNLGYTIDNIVPCCKDCNYAKRIMSIDKFKSWIESVYNHFVKSH